MKVRVFSDLHLEFGDFDPGTGDVLVLAGDICTAESFVTPAESSLADTYKKFFTKCVERYNKVFYTPGNHEAYHYTLGDVVPTLRATLPPDISILDDQSELYNGWHFVGSTLWTNFGGGDGLHMMNAARCMNDYQIISNGDRVLTPEDTLKRHTNSIGWLRQVLPTLRGNVFMFSHHAPSLRSFKKGYREESAKFAYASDLEKIILDNPNVKYWAHGHIHESNDYNIGECRVISNPRGYSGYSVNSNFQSRMELNLNN